MTGDISEVFSKFAKFPVAIVSGGRDKVFFCISRDHIINESHDSLGYPHPKSQRWEQQRATEDYGDKGYGESNRTQQQK